MEGHSNRFVLVIILTLKNDLYRTVYSEEFFEKVYFEKEKHGQQSSKRTGRVRESKTNTQKVVHSLLNEIVDYLHEGVHDFYTENNYK